MGFPAYELKTETVVLPDKGRGFTIWGDGVDTELAGYAFHRRVRIEGGEFRMEASSRALKPEITLAEAKAASAPLTELGKGTVRIRSPKETAQARTDRKTLLATQPTTRSGYIERGGAFLDDGRYAEALKDFDKAVDLDPGSAEALAHRGLAHAWLGQSAAAKADLDRAETLDPSQIVLWRARGLIALQDREADGAVIAFTHALQLQAGDLFSLGNRANAYAMAKDYPRALADLDVLSTSKPDDVSVKVRKATIYRLMHDSARAEALAADDGAKGEAAIRGRVSILLAAGDKVAARAAADTLVASFPTSQNHVLRAAVRGPTDRAGAEADYRDALAADKANQAALAGLARLRAAAGDAPGALGYADALVALAPEQSDIRILRGTVRAKAGKAEEARQDFAFVRARSAADAITLNNLCYDQATTNFDLPQALADCDASLRLQPKSPATLDSRAFVLLRLGRDKEARMAFDASLAERDDGAASLFGRSIAERRLGDAAAADRDLKAAVAQNDAVVQTFADYGVTR